MKIKDFYYNDGQAAFDNYEDSFYDTEPREDYTEPSPEDEYRHLVEWMEEMKQNKIDILRIAKEWEEENGRL